MEREPGGEKQGDDELDRLAEAFKQAGLNFSKDDLARADRAGFHVGYIRNADGEIEYTKPLPHVDFGRGGATQETFEPVEAANITPTEKRPETREMKWILVYGDGQVDYRRIIDPVTGEQELMPIHSLEAHNIIKQLNADFQPETTVNLGDFADMAAFSRFSPDSDHFHKTLGPSMRYIHDFYAQLRADNPDGHHVEVDSNHAVRPKKRVLEQLPALHDYIRPGEEHPYPMMTYYYLANLGKLGVDFVSGYGAAEFIYGQEYNAPIAFKHGTHSSSSLGATVRKEAAENPHTHVVRGHGHRDEEVRTTDRYGVQRIYKMLGSTCLNNGPVPGYHSSIDDFNRPVSRFINHQNTVMLIADYQDGTYGWHTLDIINGKARFMGQEYNGNE